MNAPPLRREGRGRAVFFPGVPSLGFGAGQLDARGELPVVLRSADEVPLLRAARHDEERRRAADAVGARGGLVGPDLGRVGAAVQRSLPLVHVEVQLLGVRVEVVTLDLLLVAEELVVEGPEGARAL